MRNFNDKKVSTTTNKLASRHHLINHNPELTSDVKQNLEIVHLLLIVCNAVVGSLMLRVFRSPYYSICNVPVFYRN